MPQSEKRFYEFGSYRLDIKTRVLLRESEIVPLTPKALDTLLVLVERHGELVERKELVKAVWPDVYVEESNLNSHIFMLRKALSGDGEDYITTVPRRGYRFVASVREIVIGSERREKSEASFRPSSPEIKSLAVLPFNAFCAEGCEVHLGLGLADALITRLSNLRRMIVRPTSAVSKYRGLEQDPLSAGRELDVELVLGGSIQQKDERIRVTVQLVSVADGRPLWAEKFDENFTDIFSVEDAISSRVAEALTFQLADDERKLLTKHHTNDTEAYQLYLQGYYYWNQRTAEGLKKSIDYFNRAIARDPNYALAYAGLAESYALLGCVHGALSPRESMPQAKAAALKAIELDDQLVEGHTALGLVRVLYDWNWSGAEAEYLRALDLNPTHVTARHWYGLYLAWLGRLEEAIIELQRSQQLDPFSPIISANIGWAYYAARRYDEAIRQCREAIAMAPNFYRSYLYLGSIYAEVGDFDAALAKLKRVTELTGCGPEVTNIGYVYAQAGRIDEARSVIAELQWRAAQSYVSPYPIALVHAGLGEADQAFFWLERAREDRTHWLVFLKAEPKLDNIRNDQRFRELLRQVGLDS